MVIVTAAVVFSIAAKVAICHQIALNWRRKTTKGMSVPFFVLALLSYGTWTLDGFTGGGWSLVLGQGPGVVLCLLITFQAWLYDRGGKSWLLASGEIAVPCSGITGMDQKKALAVRIRARHAVYRVAAIVVFPLALILAAASAAFDWLESVYSRFHRWAYRELYRQSED